VAGFVLLSFILGLLINQSEIPVPMNGILTKLSGESAFMLMSLLGATLVPHNFYLHSSIVQVLLPLILNFHLCKCSEMSVSMACCQENIFYLLAGVFKSHVLLVRKDELSDCCYFLVYYF
jgi:Mn2+/Fe2+ NRAMP family transporter